MIGSTPNENDQESWEQKQTHKLYIQKVQQWQKNVVYEKKKNNSKQTDEATDKRDSLVFVLMLTECDSSGVTFLYFFVCPYWQ